MYDDAIRGAVIERVRDVVRDLSNHPLQAAVVAAGVALVLFWICRKK